MSKNSKRIMISAILIVLAFVLGMVLQSNIGITDSQTKTTAKNSQTKTTLPEGCELAQKLSEAFESATSMVDQSVVPIFAEQEVQVQSPFAGPTDPFRDFFGDEFFKLFFWSSATG